jgi:putative addiction module killer protein
MVVVHQTETFREWLRKLRDRKAAAKIAARLARLELGNFGDAEPVGQGVTELRVHFGPGYRVYVVQRGDVLVVVLCGGDKASQARDIKKAKTMAQELET